MEVTASLQHCFSVICFGSVQKKQAEKNTPPHQKNFHQNLTTLHDQVSNYISLRKGGV